MEIRDVKKLRSSSQRFPLHTLLELLDHTKMGHDEAANWDWPW